MEKNVIDFEGHKIKKLQNDLDDITVVAMNMYSCFDYMYSIITSIEDPLVKALTKDKPESPEAITAIVSLVVKYLDKRNLSEIESDLSIGENRGDV